MSTTRHTVPITRQAYSVAEVAEIVGLSERMLRKQMSKGKLAFTRVGRRVLISDVHLKAFLSGSKNVDTTEVARSLVKQRKPSV